MKGRRALVCGASRGIGLAVARGLAEAGCRVTLLARDRDRLDARVRELREAGADADALVADYDDRPALERLVTERLADDPFHVLVHNSGGPKGGPMLSATEAELISAFGRTVLVGQILVRACLPGMRAAGYGRIVNVLSTSLREPIPGLGVGNTARAATGGWAKTLAAELPPGVTINNVLPGYTDTERLSELAAAAAVRTGASPESIRASWAAAAPEGRVGDPDEIAALVVFLCSPAAGYVRGQSIAADGGRLKGI